MNLIRLLPVLLSIILLAAHFLRDGQMLFVTALLLVPFLLFIRRPWVVRLFQVGLVVGGVEWLLTAYKFIQVRQLMGESWGRLALILGAVALFTAGSALVFRSRSLRDRYFKQQENLTSHDTNNK